MNAREKQGLHHARKQRKRWDITAEKRGRVANKKEREEKRARDKKNRERRERIIQEHTRELQEKQRFLSGGVFFTYPGAALLFDTEAEAREHGGDNIRRFNTVSDAVRYARGEQDAERRENTKKRTEQDGKKEQGAACPE